MQVLWRIYKFMVHVLCASNTKGHGVHSPYLYRFTNNVLYDSHHFYFFNRIEQRRTELLQSHQIIDKLDFGSGKSKQLAVGAITRKSLCTTRKGRLLARISCHFKCQKILELGTSFGISTSYLSAPCFESQCITLEGCPSTARIANQTFEALGLTQVKLLEGNIDHTLAAALSELKNVDFVYIDANHTYEATLRYFETITSALGKNAIVVIDDIYWSPQMLQAWKTIQHHPKVTTTIDLFRVGIVFFNSDLNKTHYKMI